MKAMALGAIIGLSTMTMTACGSTSDKAADSQPSAAASSPVSPSSTPESKGKQAASGSGGGQAAGSGGVTVLEPTNDVIDSVRDAYLEHAMQEYPKETQANLDGPNESHYGRINGKYYFIADIGFKDNPVSRQDGPHVWVSPNGSDWSYEGETGGNPCESKVPVKLAKALKVPCV